MAPHPPTRRRGEDVEEQERRGRAGGDVAGRGGAGSEEVVPEQRGHEGVADVAPADEPGLDVGLEPLAKLEPREEVLVRLGRVRGVEEGCALPLPSPRVVTKG